MIIADDREKKNAHVLKYFSDNGHNFTVRRMDVADYMIEGAPGIVVDRKQNLEEVAQNLATVDRGRFYREMRRAYESGVKMYVLCEHGKDIRSIRDVAAWHSRFSTISGRVLMDRMISCEMAYGVKFLFCGKSETGKKILDILGGNIDVQ